MKNQIKVREFKSQDDMILWVFSLCFSEVSPMVQPRLAQEEEERMEPGKSTPSIFASEMPQYHQSRPIRRRMAKIVSTWQFETLFAVIIFAHAILLGVQIEWESRQKIGMNN